MKKLHLAIASILLLVAVGVCTAQTDSEFASKAAIAGKKEVALGRMAAAKGQSASLKTFGPRMVADHTTPGTN